jgi:cell division protease FtsH
MAVGERDQQIFLGREFAHRREISERTSRIVDEEVKRMLDEAFEQATVILTENRELLELFAQTLLERETLNGEQLDILVDGKTLPPMEVPEHGVPGSPTEQGTGRPASSSPPILGSPGAEPAGA